METIEVRTEKTVFGGETIAKVNSRTVFIPYALPNETLNINIVQQKNDYSKAQIIKIIEPSPYRIKSECRYYGVCGGCNLMHAAPDYQRELKKQMLINAFEKYKIDISDKIEIIKGPDYNYRARFQLTDGGLNEKNKNTVIPITQCLCAETPVNDYLEKTEFNQRPKGRIHIFGSSFIEGQDKLKISEKENENKTRIYGNRKKNLKLKENHYFTGTVSSPENRVTVKLNGKSLSFDVRGFFQSNLFVFEKVLKLITDSLPGGKNCLDLYSGCASISAFLADKYESVTLVEHNRDALVFAEQNMAGKNHKSYGLSGENFVKKYALSLPRFDACVVDPPRSGMENAVCDYLCKSRIPFIRSLSCDPSTHSRDCARLISSGYELSKIYLLDFYPHTSHIESLAIFNLNI